jgi:adenylyltransferase/sulfurtransferase
MQQRYSRQIIFNKIGKAGQENLLKSSVIIIGCGALGCSTSNLLARAGVGRIKICDRDFVEIENLQRQSLFDEEDVKQNLPKVIAAANKLRRINSQIKIEPEICDVNFTNIEKLITGFDLVLDATDNFETRFLINDACVKLKIPWIYTACVGSYGMVMVFIPEKTPCFRCLIPQIPDVGSSPTCDTAGILNTVVSLVTSIQANEAIKFLSGNRADVSDTLFAVEIWSNRVQFLKLAKSPDCPCCCKRYFEFLEGEAEQTVCGLCGRNAVYILPLKKGVKIDIEELSKKLSPLGKTVFNQYLLKFYINQFEMTVFPDGRAIIKGTEDTARAKSLYAKYIGA